MRSLLGFLVLAAVLVGLLAVFAVPALVAPMVASAVRDTSPFGDRPLDVEVDVDALGLLQGVVREIWVSGTDLQTGAAAIGSLDVVLRDVGIDDHEFQAMTGRLGSVTVPLGDGKPVSAATVTLGGASPEVQAHARLEPADAEAVVRASLVGAGLDVGQIDLVDGGVAAEIGGQRVEVALEVTDGSVVAISRELGIGPITVLAPSAGDAWRVSALTVRADGVEIDALVDTVQLLARSELPRSAVVATR